jgi:hypothetical protein
VPCLALISANNFAWLARVIGYQISNGKLRMALAQQQTSAKIAKY